MEYRDLDKDQLAAIDFILSGEDALLVCDIGTGKTVIMLTAAFLALARDEIRRWLVLAPLLVASDTWRKESALWDHLNPADVAIACGTEAERIAAIESDARVVVMNYENLAWLLDRYPKGSLPFDGLACDEIDKLKTVSSQRFKAFRNRIKEFKKRIGLTGTLLPNDILEVWGQVYILDGGQSFGRSFYKWRSEYFYPVDFNQYTWKAHRDTRQTIIDTISDLSYRIKGKGLPKVRPLEPQLLTLPDDIRARYKELENDYYLTVTDSDDKEHVIDAASAGVLAVKLQQICAGFSYSNQNAGNRDVIWHSKARFDWLYHLLDTVPGQLLVFYHFNEELDELKRQYPGIPHLGKGTTNTQARQHIADWNRGKLDMLCLHPASAGHGLNLQHSGAHDIVFLTLPWSGGLYKQSVGRLARRGQRSKNILVHTALFEDTIDQTVFNAVTGKMSGLDSFLDDLETAIGTKT